MIKASLFITSACLAVCFSAFPCASAERSGADPEVNKTFADPKLDVSEWVAKFEVESREVYKFRKRIVAAAALQAGHHVADLGAGTGLFTFLFAKSVGRQGKVFAVEVSPNFLTHLEKEARKRKVDNVKVVQGSATSANLPASSVDRIFICDTYHHFEHPELMLGAIATALRPGGQVVLVDFKREEGVSSAWTLKHVRAGEEQVVAEFLRAGFVVDRRESFLKDNYLIVFRIGPTQR